MSRGGKAPLKTVKWKCALPGSFQKEQTLKIPSVHRIVNKLYTYVAQLINEYSIELLNQAN